MRGEQAPDGAAPEQERDPEAVSARNLAVLAYEARRCRVCGAPHPAFGFGPPLTRKGHDLWACGLHRGDVERLLRGTARLQASSEGTQLL